MCFLPGVFHKRLVFFLAHLASWGEHAFNLEAFFSPGTMLTFTCVCEYSTAKQVASSLLFSSGCYQSRNEACNDKIMTILSGCVFTGKITMLRTEPILMPLLLLCTDTGKCPATLRNHVLSTYRPHLKHGYSSVHIGKKKLCWDSTGPETYFILFFKCSHLESIPTRVGTVFAVTFVSRRP